MGFNDMAATLTQAPGYHTESEDINGLIITDCWFAPWADMIGGGHGFRKGQECPYLAELCLAKIDLKPDTNRIMGYVNLVYQPRDSVEIGVDTNKAKYSLSKVEVQQSIELLPKYKKHWNFHLAIKSGLSTPEWWATDDKDTDSTSGLRTSYQWVKELSDVNTESIGQNFTHVNKTKPGKEVYVLYSPVVVARLVFSQFAKAEAASKTAGTIATPKKTFGYTGYEWLVGGGDIDQNERGKWFVDLTYTGALDIDRDFYDEA